VRRVQRRGLLIGVSAVLGFCLLGCVLVFVSVIPSFRDEVRDGVHDAVATEVALQIPVVGGAAQPGTYTLSAADLEARLHETLDDEQDEQDPVVRITDTYIEIGVTSQGQDAIYTGKPIAEDGKLTIQEMSTDNGIVRFVLPPDTIANAIEDAVNSHLDSNNLRLDTIELADGQLTLVVSAA
jgi:hypothetical protein